MKGCDELLGLQDTLKALADPIRREILNLPENYSSHAPYRAWLLIFYVIGNYSVMFL